MPADWLVAVVPEPRQRLADSDRQEDQVLGQLFSGDGQTVATRLRFLYHRGLATDQETSAPTNQISARYDRELDQYELSSVERETTIQRADAAADWITEQFLTVETVVDTYLIMTEAAADIHGLGRTGVDGLVDTFETLAAIRDADIDTLADVPYVSEENAAALQTALADVR